MIDATYPFIPIQTYSCGSIFADCRLLVVAMCLIVFELSSEFHTLCWCLRYLHVFACVLISGTSAQEMLVRKNTNGETWVQHVLEGLVSNFACTRECKWSDALLASWCLERYVVCRCTQYQCVLWPISTEACSQRRSHPDIVLLCIAQSLFAFSNCLLLCFPSCFLSCFLVLCQGQVRVVPIYVCCAVWFPNYVSQVCGNKMFHEYFNKGSSRWWSG